MLPALCPILPGISVCAFSAPGRPQLIRPGTVPYYCLLAPGLCCFLSKLLSYHILFILSNLYHKKKMHNLCVFCYNKVSRTLHCAITLTC